MDHDTGHYGKLTPVPSLIGYTGQSLMTLAPRCAVLYSTCNDQFKMVPVSRAARARGTGTPNMTCRDRLCVM